MLSVYVEFSCWASAHGCSVVQVRARGKSTNHEYGEREAACTCLACLAATASRFWEMIVIKPRFCHLADLVVLICCKYL